MQELFLNHWSKFKQPMVSFSPTQLQSKDSATAVYQSWAIILLALLAFSLPFELDTPLFHLGPIAVTNVELLLGLVLLTAVYRAIRYKIHPTIPRSLLLWVVAFLLILLLSIIFAPNNQTNAFKASLRLVTGLALALFAIPILVRNGAQLRLVLWATLSGGLLAAAIGLWEYGQNRELLWLAPLRQQPTVAGAFIRLTGPFDYANQAAMFIEATLPILILTLTFLWSKQKTVVHKISILVLGGLMSLFYLQAAFLTFSRTSVATIALVGLLMAALLWQRHSQSKNKMSMLWLGVTTAVLILTLLNTQFNNIFRLRLQTEGDNEWYRAELIAPELWQMESNEKRIIPITLTNDGALTWRSVGNQPFNLGARWLNNEDEMTYGEPRWPFATPVTPGQTVTMDVLLQAPAQAGTYELIWDVVQEQVTWFGVKSNKYTISQVTVTAGKQPKPSNTVAPSTTWEYPLPIPDRRTLWLTAFTLWQQRPLLGIGADNYRLTYGQALGATSWNETIHSNNWYIETAVSLGILGSLLVFGGMLILCIDMLRTLRQKTISFAQIALAAGIFAFFIHGLLDFFLLFNATGILFWLLLGLWLTANSYPPTNKRIYKHPFGQDAQDL